MHNHGWIYFAGWWGSSAAQCLDAGCCLYLVWGDYHRNGIWFLSVQSPITPSAVRNRNKRSHIASMRLASFSHHPSRPTASSVQTLELLRKLLLSWTEVENEEKEGAESHPPPTTTPLNHRLHLVRQTQSVWRVTGYESWCCCQMLPAWPMTLQKSGAAFLCSEYRRKMLAICWLECTIRMTMNGWMLARWLEGIYLNVPCIRVRVQQPLRLSISLYGMHVGLTGGGWGNPLIRFVCSMVMVPIGDI